MKKLLILATIVLLARSDFRAPFQASIQLKSSNGKQLCNGVIIHEQYILTTANCLYLRVTIAGGVFSILVPEGDLTIVVGGSYYNSTTQIERNVDSIIPHHKFNRTTNDNDIAVLKLDRALPLANSTEIQWLDIATGSIGSMNNSCFLTTFNSSQTNATRGGFYSIWKQPANETCNDRNGTNLIRKTDLCLEYFLSSSADCNSTSINLTHSNERGTAYVCDNKLVAILADINPPRSVEKCFEKKQTTAYYVDVRSQVEWLSNDLGIFQKQNSSVPSWTLRPENTETSSSTSTSTTTGSSKIPSSGTKISSSFILILLLINLIIFNMA